jgi:hypothetical protein
MDKGDGYSWNRTTTRKGRERYVIKREKDRRIIKGKEIHGR